MHLRGGGPLNLALMRADIHVSVQASERLPGAKSLSNGCNGRYGQQNSLCVNRGS